MDRFIQIICDLLGDVGCTESMDVLQKEFSQCVSSQSQEEQTFITQQFVSQLKVVLNELSDTQSQHTQTNDSDFGDAYRAAKRIKLDVQITASKQELDKRISAFIASKRLENDISNQQEFCVRDDGAGSASARTDVADIKRKQQIKYSRVVNEEDPLSSTSTSSSVKEAAGKLVQLPWGVEERLRNLEHYMAMPNIPPRPLPSDVYHRLKALENRLLDLENAGWSGSPPNSTPSSTSTVISQIIPSPPSPPSDTSPDSTVAPTSPSVSSPLPVIPQLQQTTTQPSVPGSSERRIAELTAHLYQEQLKKSGKQ